MKEKIALHAFWHGLAIKILSLLFATGIYIVYRTTLQETINYVIPIEVEVPADKVLTYLETKEVRLSLSGRKEALEVVQSDEFSAFVDLESFAAGSATAPIQVDERFLRESGLNFELQPTTLAVSLENLQSKTVPVVANIIGYPSPGYTLENYSFQPELVELTGPESFIDPLNSITTEAVDISVQNSSFEETVPLRFPKNIVTVKPRSTATYTIILKEQTGVLNLSVTINLVNLASRLEVTELTPTDAAVTLSGSQLALASLATNLQDGIKVIADASEVVTAGRYSLQLTVVNAENFNVLKIQPSTVTLLVTRQGQNQLLIPQVEGRSAAGNPILSAPLSNSN